MTELYPPGLDHAEMHVSTGDMPLSASGRPMSVELEGGVDLDYYHHFKVTSTDDLALVDKVMAGIVAQCAFSEGSVSGPYSRMSAIHGYLQVYNAGISGGAKSALATLQTLGAGGQVIDAGIDILAAGQTVTDLIKLTSGTIVNFFQSIAVANVVNSAKTGSGTITGYLKCDIDGTDRWLYFYDAAPA